jgi:hypothetical protein
VARPRGIRRPLAGHRPVTKAALPGGIQLPSGAQTSSLAPQIAALQQQTGQGQAGAVTMAEPLPRQFSDFIAAFGPGVPLVPAPLNGVREDTGQPDPRRYAYPVSWNLSRDMQRHTPWSLLIQAADKVDIIRRCIEARKDEQIQQDWDFTLSKRALEAAGANTPAEKSALREKYSDKIRQLVDWWQTPDKTNGYEFETWLSMALEEHFVLDALAIYPRLTYGGDLSSLEVLDGSTIKPLLDARGNRPPAPAPAFQQWLYGFPRGEYTDLGPSDSWEGDAGSLIYAVRTARTRSPYGLSTVEQALVSADLWMHRQQWMRSEYTEGTLPTSWLTVDQAAGNMTPDQIRAWETSLNDFYGGGISQRHRMRLLPQGVSPIDTMDVSERYKPDYDEFLVKLVISHFNVDPMEIGFAPKGGLGGKGFSEGQQDTKYRQAIKPLNTFLSNIINQISRRYLGMPPELTHQFLGMEQEDEESADEVAAARTSSGRSTFNEDRDRQGMPRYPGEWADKPFVMTASGPVWLDDAYEKSQEPPEPVPAPLAPHVPGQPAAREPGTPPVGEDNEPDDDEEADQEAAEKAVGELVAFGRFLAKRGKLSRPFAFEHLDKAAGELLNETAVTDPEWAAELAGDIVKVGPKGYIHGWIYVGGPGLPRPRTGSKPNPVHAPDNDAIRAARARLRADSPAARAKQSSTLHDDKGRTITITAAEKQDVKAAKLHPTQQMLYTSNRFRGVDHKRSLELARSSTPATGRTADRGQISGFVGNLPKPAPGGRGRIAGELPDVPEPRKQAERQGPGLKEVEALRSAYEKGHDRQGKPLSGGNSADLVELIKLSNGQKAVRKHQTARDTRAEYLTGRVANALGIDGITVAQVSNRETVSNFVEGEPGAVKMKALLKKVGSDNGKREVLKTERARQARLRNGREIAMLDWITDNDDRHELNWMVSPDGKSVIPIDHGSANFEADVHPLTGRHKVPRSPFIEEWIRPKMEDYREFAGADPQWTPAEIAKIRTSIEALRDEFSSADERRWHKFMLSRLDMLEAK